MKRRKTLVIDDEKHGFQFLMQSFVATNDPQVFVARPIQAGFVYLGQKHPDSIPLDNKLPGNPGWENIEFILKFIYILPALITHPKPSPPGFAFLRSHFTLKK